MSDLYTNTAQRRDFFGNAFVEHSTTPRQVLVAVAFLTDPTPLLDLQRRGCSLKVIVRLGYPTAPQALRALLGIERVQVRYINNSTFHPKLYIFEERCALVGSSNMTRSAMTSNQEVNVALGIEDPRYEELVCLFAEYWRQVRVLELGTVTQYERIYRKYQAACTDVARMDLEVEALAATRIDNIERGERDTSREELFLEGYRATYQGFLDAFTTVRRLYGETGRRKVSEDVLPLRLEIDSFLSWVRDTFTTADSYLEAPILQGAARELKVQDAIRQWFKSAYPWFDNQVVPVSYPRITAILGSMEALQGASYEQIVDALSCEHSFYERLRFFSGGHATHRQAFMTKNDLARVKRTLSFLLYGREDPVVRMGRCIFDPEYQLKEFGRSAVQELLGWINGEDIPVCNNRTLRSLRWLGFDVALVGG